MRDLLNAPIATGPLGPVVTRLDSAIRWVCGLVLWTTFVALLAPTFANAVLRYTTDASLNWSVEVVQLVFPWFIMAGAVMAAQHGRHIGVELFVTLLPMKLARWIAVPVQALILMACGTVIYVYLGLGMFEGGMDYAAGDVSFTSIGLPQSWSYAALLFGYALLGLTALSTLYRLVSGGHSRIEDELGSVVPAE